MAAIVVSICLPGHTTKGSWERVTSDTNALIIKKTSLGLSPPNRGGNRFEVLASRCWGIPSQLQVFNTENHKHSWATKNKICCWPLTIKKPRYIPVLQKQKSEESLWNLYSAFFDDMHQKGSIGQLMNQSSSWQMSDRSRWNQCQTWQSCQSIFASTTWARVPRRGATDYWRLATTLGLVETGMHDHRCQWNLAQLSWMRNNVSWVLPKVTRQIS